MSENKKAGRPKLTNAKNIRIQVRVTKEEKAKLKHLAESKGISISELLLSSTLKKR